MVAGHLREKNGYFYAVLNYNDSLGNNASLTMDNYYTALVDHDMAMW